MENQAESASAEPVQLNQSHPEIADPAHRELIDLLHAIQETLEKMANAQQAS